MMPAADKVASLYTEMAAVRDPFLRRARECSALVGPDIIPPEGYDGTTNFTRRYDSTGAQGLLSLVSETMRELFPTDRSFVRFEVSPIERAKLLKETNEDEVSRLEATMLFAEQALLRRYVQTHLDGHMPNVLKHVFTAGNVCIHITANGRPKIHGMDNYVTKRNYLGDPVFSIIREWVAKKVIKGRVPEEVWTQIEEAEGKTPVAADDRVELFTVVARYKLTDFASERIHVQQYAMNQKLEDSSGSFAVNESPFIFSWAQPVTGLDYGYGYVHTNYDDLLTLDELTKDVTQISASAAVLRWIVKRGSLASLSLRKLKEMRNGSYIYGDPEGITPITLQGKMSDVVMVENRIAALKAQIERAFLMFEATRRKAERVTAFENSLVNSELKAVLSSFYGPMTSQLQEPIALVQIAQMKREGSLPKFKHSFVRPTIITGASALSRQTTTQALLNATQVVTQAWTPTMERYANFEPFSKAVYDGMGVTVPKGMWKTKETVAQEDQARALENATPEIIKQGSTPN